LPVFRLLRRRRVLRDFRLEPLRLLRRRLERRDLRLRLRRERPLLRVLRLERRLRRLLRVLRLERRLLLIIFPLERFTLVRNLFNELSNLTSVVCTAFVAGNDNFFNDFDTRLKRCWIRVLRLPPRFRVRRVVRVLLLLRPIYNNS